MRPRNILIIYGTSYGQTEKIAARIQAVLVKRGHAVTLANAAKPMPPAPLALFDGIVVGSSIIAGGHQKSVQRFVRAKVGLLNGTASAFYSVCGAAGSKDPKERASAERLRDEFLKRLGWKPQLRASIAGAINYTRYNPFLRWYMKRASAKGGGSTDTTRDHEYTDWEQVERFAADISQMIQAWPSASVEKRAFGRGTDGAFAVAR